MNKSTNDVSKGSGYENYTTLHYAHTNKFALSADIPQVLRAQFELAYGDLVRSGGGTKRILDLGCGTGHLVKWLSEFTTVEVTGIDVSFEQVNFANKLFPDLDIHQTDGLEFLLQNHNMFDGIICNDVIEHIPTLTETIELIGAMGEALREQGFLFCRVPNAANLIAAHSLFADLTHYRLYTSLTLPQIIRRGGFQEVEIVPIRPRRLIGRLRGWIEYILHKSIFLVAGRRYENVFSLNICAVAIKTNPDNNR